MGAEVGATTTTFPYTAAMRDYLHATARSPVAEAADRAQKFGFLAADDGAEYDQVIDIVSPRLWVPSSLSAIGTYRLKNLSDLEPSLNGPFTPDLATPLSQFKHTIEQQGWKDAISSALIGSCTNSSYEDMVCAL